MPTRTVAVIVDADGGFAIPADMREELGLKDGDRVTAWVVDGALHLEPAEATAKRAQPGTSTLADESSAYRRRAAEHE